MRGLPFSRAGTPGRRSVLRLRPHSSHGPQSLRAQPVVAGRAQARERAREHAVIHCRRTGRSRRGGPAAAFAVGLCAALLGFAAVTQTAEALSLTARLRVRMEIGEEEEEQPVLHTGHPEGEASRPPTPASASSDRQMGDGHDGLSVEDEGPGEGYGNEESDLHPREQSGESDQEQPVLVAGRDGEFAEEVGTLSLTKRPAGNEMNGDGAMTSAGPNGGGNGQGLVTVTPRALKKKRAPSTSKTIEIWDSRVTVYADPSTGIGRSPGSDGEDCVREPEMNELSLWLSEIPAEETRVVNKYLEKRKRKAEKAKARAAKKDANVVPITDSDAAQTAGATDELTRQLPARSWKI